MSNFSMIYSLPHNTKAYLDSKTDDDREGVLCYCDDGNNYGELRLIDNKGQAIIPKASMAKPDVLFDGGFGSEGDLVLSKPIDNYTFLYIRVDRQNSLDYDMKVVAVEHVYYSIDAYHKNVNNNSLNDDVKKRLSMRFYASPESNNPKGCHICFINSNTVNVHHVSTSSGYPLTNLKIWGIK